jgi:phosphatidylglycerophosphate synthase
MKQSADPEPKANPKPVEDAPEKVLKDLDFSRPSYFGYTEQPVFDKMSSGRLKIFRPILMLLKLAGVRSNHITGASFVLIATGFPLAFYFEQYLWAFIALAVHILLDGMDGPMARLEGKQSSGGAMLDMANDLTGMVVVVITASHFHFINPTIGFMYVVSYLYLTFTAIAQNALNISFRYIGKTKYPVYILLAIRAGTGVDITTWFCVIATAYMVTHTFIAGYNILLGLRKRDQAQ